MRGRGHPMDVFYHQWLLEDSERTDLLRRVVESLVRPGDVVADVGAGTGILGVFALRAGASKVYALEASPIVRLAKKMAEANGLDRLVFVEGDAATVELPEQVDVLVSECLGSFAFGDAMFEMVGNFAQRWLKPGGRRSPQGVRLYLQPSDVRTMELRRTFWTEPFEGLDVSAFLPGVDNVVGMTTAAPPFMLGAPAHVTSFDPMDRPASVHLEAEFALPAGRRCTSLLGWFEVDWAPGFTQSTGPGGDPTHWGQAVFAVPPRVTKEGDRLFVTLDVSFGSDEYPRYRWAGRYEDATGTLVAEFDRDTGRLWGRTEG